MRPSANRAIIAGYKKRRSFAQSGKAPKDGRKSLRVARRTLKLKRADEAKANVKIGHKRVKVEPPPYPVWKHNDWLFVTTLRFKKQTEASYDALVEQTLNSLTANGNPYGVVMINPQSVDSVTIRSGVEIDVTSQTPLVRSDLRKLSIPAYKATRKLTARADMCRLRVDYYDSHIDESLHTHGRCGCRHREDKSVPLVGTYRGVYCDLVKAKSQYEAKKAKHDAENTGYPYYGNYWPHNAVNHTHTDDALASMKRIVDDPVEIASIEFPKWSHPDENKRSVDLGYCWG